MSDGYEGTVSFYAAEKGYGFIECPGFEKNLFFHVKDLIKTKKEDIRKGAVVHFGDVHESPKGLSAKKVQVFA